MDPVFLRVGTFNIRHDADRYAERKPVLGDAFAAMDVDLIGLQEVVFGSEQQHVYLGSRRSDPPYVGFEAPSGRGPDYGNAILCRTGDVQAHETVQLSHGRVAHRVLVVLPGNRTLWFANTHLHHIGAAHDVRRLQAEAYAGWLLDAPAADAIVAVGDFNAKPVEPAYAAMAMAGFRSAFREANGAEPRLTRPPDHRAQPRGDEPACVDYIWLHGPAHARNAFLGATEPAIHDAKLFASDHLAVLADLELP